MELIFLTGLITGIIGAFAIAAAIEFIATTICFIGELIFLSILLLSLLYTAGSIFIAGIS